MDLHAGVAPPVPGQEMREQILDHLRRCADPEYSCLSGLERARALSERFGVRQQVTAAPQQVFPLRCELHAATDPVEQRHSQFSF